MPRLTLSNFMGASGGSLKLGEWLAFGDTVCNQPHVYK